MHRSSLPPARARVADLRLPADLPTRDLERLAASAAQPPAPTSAPATYGLNKFDHPEGSPADVRIYGPSAAAPLLMRRLAVSPSHPGPALVLPNLSLPHSSPTTAPLPLPPVSQPRSAGADLIPPGSLLARSGVRPLRRATAGKGSISVPTSPANVSTGMTPNEIKKAQNRKSAKRFREAQKQRWKNMADELLMHKKTIAELRASLAARDACDRRMSSVMEVSAKNPGDFKRGMAINDLVDTDTNTLPLTSPLTPPVPNMQMFIEAEASLYAQLLSNSTTKLGGNPSRVPYVNEIGLLQLSYVVVGGTTRVVSIRRGSATALGTFAVDGLNPSEATEFRTALTCGKPVQVSFVRQGRRVNAVMNPVESSDRVVVAEFAPIVPIQ